MSGTITDTCMGSLSFGHDDCLASHAVMHGRQNVQTQGCPLAKTGSSKTALQIEHLKLSEMSLTDTNILSSRPIASQIPGRDMEGTACDAP
mmetsp:Transcript_86304/g.241372  ORF Transcript_86304/g.241372 Transcript_86304/m.241372 type:complete len:91 (-) Transcript_86304:17-289(-)